MTILRRLALLLSLPALACGGAATAPESDRDVEGEVRARFESLVAAAESLDDEAYFGHFDGRLFTALNADGTTADSFDVFRSGYLAGVEAIDAYEDLTFSRVKVTVIDPRNAILINEFVARVRLADGSVAEFAGAGSQVWHQSGGEWLLVSVSSSAPPN
ncbi:MAG: DUF4440 domain-containing protein [Acidobacteriota bacterium]